MANVKLDVDAFFRRFARLEAGWEESELKEVSSVLVGVGTDDETVYSKSASMQVWLFGYELADTLMVLTRGGEMHFLASKKKIEFLRPLEAKDEKKRVKLIVRDKADNDKKNLTRITDVLRAAGDKVGVIAKDQKYPGSFMDAWRAHWSALKGDFETKDVNAALTLLLAPKEESELALAKKAASVSNEVFSKYLKEELMDIIDNEKKVKHAKISENVEQALSDKKYAGNLDVAQLESCYPPIVQSGGNFKLKFSVVSDKEPLHFGAIICSFGARYKSYCSNIARTMLVNPSKELEASYEFLLSLEEFLINNLVDGAKLSSVYEKTLKKVKDEKPNLVDKLTKNFGFAMGIEFRDASISISPSCDVIAKKGMLFNLNLGFNNLTNSNASDDKGKSVALFLGDTIIVNEGSPATLLTTSKKRIKHIAIILKDADSEEEEKENKNNLPDPEHFGRGKRSVVRDQKLRQDTTNEDKRKKHQRELMHKMNEEALERIKSGVDVKKVNKMRKAPVSYKSPGQLPRERDVKQLKIYVDKKYETIILPIFGVPVPFHVATVKNISQSVEGDYTYLRINFIHPGASLGKDGGIGFLTSPDATFLKELTYRSTNVREPGEISTPSSNLNNVFRLIKELQKKYRTREAEEKEKADLVTQDTLVILQGKGNPKLKDLYIRPNLTQKRLSGLLEAHSNGFRYTSIRGDKVDILYNNIKHAFFQPCDGEMIILLHFHLKNPILFGKKKQLDVQFYTEVGEITTDLGKHQHMHDRDDLASEQAERELRHKLKQAFKSFCDKVDNLTKSNVELEFDTPFRELGFHGVPFRETVLLQPTGSCLVNLTSWPPFVVTLEDIQLVHFERVQFQLKNFDMVFIFKDYTKKVMMVTTIPMNMLDHVKEWLNSVDIKYTEGVQSLNWPKILKTIVDDPEGFFESGGWNFLDTGSDQEADDDDEDEEDEEFQASGDDPSAGDDSDDSEYSSEVESEDYSEQELDSDESSGKDWSDLEREAAEDDEDLEDGPSHKKSKHSSSGKHHRDKGRHSDKRKRQGSDSMSRSHHHKSPKKARR